MTQVAATPCQGKERREREREREGVSGGKRGDGTRDRGDSPEGIPRVVLKIIAILAKSAYPGPTAVNAEIQKRAKCHEDRISPARSSIPRPALTGAINERDRERERERGWEGQACQGREEKRWRQSETRSSEGAPEGIRVLALREPRGGVQFGPVRNQQVLGVARAQIRHPEEESPAHLEPEESDRQCGEAEIDPVPVDANLDHHRHQNAPEASEGHADGAGESRSLGKPELQVNDCREVGWSDSQTGESEADLHEPRGVHFDGGVAQEERKDEGRGQEDADSRSAQVLHEIAPVEDAPQGEEADEERDRGSHALLAEVPGVGHELAQRVLDAVAVQRWRRVREGRGGGQKEEGGGESWGGGGGALTC